MRTLIAILAMLITGTWLPLAAQQLPPQAPPGQQQPPGQQPQPQNPQALAQQLDTMLGVWENMLPNTQTVLVEFNALRKYNNNGTGLVKRFHGQAKFMRLPDGLIGARVRLDELDQAGRPIPDKYEEVVCTGMDVYFVEPQAKEIHHRQLPKQKVGQVPDQGPLAFLFGMKKADALRRYKMQVTMINESWYSYLEVRPKFPADEQEFTYARLVVMNRALQRQDRSIPAFMPREFYWIEPTQNENTWDITFIRQNDFARVLRTDFQKPPLGPGWKFKKMENGPPQANGGQPNNPGLPPNKVRN